MLSSDRDTAAVAFEQNGHAQEAGDGYPSRLIIERAEAALRRLDDPAFLDKLADLHQRCPWATRFQAADFITIWYRAYASTAEPILIYRVENDRLTGFFSLAMDRQSGDLAAAGKHQAEYQAWLTEKDDAQAFIDEALTLIKAHLGPDRLTLKYLPPEVPDVWSGGGFACGAQAVTRTHKRPILNLDDADALVGKLRNKKYRGRLNRLGRQGEVRFDCLEGKAALTPFIGDIVDYCDLRQGSMNAICPFRDDPYKKRFHLDMLDADRLLHCAMLTVGDRLAAAHLGIVDGDRLIVYLYSFSPFLAKHSPGKFLILMLAERLAKDGMKVLDLTPGGAYKDDFANGQDEVLEVTIFFGAKNRLRHQAADRARSWARHSLGSVGFSVDDARQATSRLRVLHPIDLSRRTLARLWRDREYRIYNGGLDDLGREKPSADFNRDNIDDLLSIPGVDRQPFLAACESRLANGHHLLTHVVEGHVRHHSWIAPSGSRVFLPDVDQAYHCPDDGILLYDHGATPNGTGADLFRQSILASIDWAKAAGMGSRLRLVVPGDEPAWHRVIDDLGLDYEGSLGLTSRAGSVKHWTTGAV